MIRKHFMALLAAAGMALSATALAQEAYTMRPINVRAGPERDFPLVATLGPGTPVHVNGCVANYIWCDIDFGGNRGWVIGSSLQYYYGGGVVPLYSYAPTIGLPIVTFSLLPYWNTYYRSRPWYADHPRWEQRWHSYDRQTYRSTPNYAYPRQQIQQATPREFHQDRSRIENRPPPQAYVPQQHPNRPPVQQAQPRPPVQQAQPQARPPGQGRGQQGYATTQPGNDQHQGQ